MSTTYTKRTITFSPAAPAPGANLDFTVPTDGVVRIVEARFVTSAVAANRELFVQKRTAAGPAGLSGSGITQTASLDKRYYIQNGSVADTVSTDEVAPMAAMVVQRGDIIRISATNIQAADQISEARIALER